MNYTETFHELFPAQRGNVVVDNGRFLDAIIPIAQNGCT
jgi:hypothetical protein